MHEDGVMADDARTTHWDEVYARTKGEGVSWFQREATTSLSTIAGLPIVVESVVDVGGGASSLVDGLVTAGVGDITVVDVSVAALAIVRERLGTEGVAVNWIVSDVVAWEPERTFDVWHDRAVFHFLTEAVDRERYLSTMSASVRANGYAVVATFALDGPERCSNLPTMRYSAAGLSSAMGEGFVVEHAFRDIHVTPTGAEQPFTWVVARRVSQ